MMARLVRVGVLLLLLVGPSGLSVRGQDEGPVSRLFDTGTASAGLWSEKELAQPNRWRLVPEDTVAHAFAGDAVMLNDKLTVVLRKRGRGPEIYSKMLGAHQMRATLGRAESPAAELDVMTAFSIRQNSAAGVTLEANFQNHRPDKPAALVFRLTTGEATLEIQSPSGTGCLAVETRTRYVVVPDFFGDDLVYGPEGFRGLGLPAENFCLNLLEGGDAMLMSVWRSADQECWLAPAPANPAGLRSHRIRCLAGKSIWLAFLEAPQIWQATPQAVPNPWKPVFPAKWRASLLRTNEVADSWDLELGAGAEQQARRHPGPLLIYPIDRTKSTPLTATCPTDVMRNTLGVGPCQYILACEGMNAQGDPTPNSVMNWVEKQFEQKKDRKVADDIQERLEFMAKHVEEARSRIERYAQFAGQVRRPLAGKASPLLAIIDDLDRAAATGLTAASSPARARQLAHDVIALIGKDNAHPTCLRLGQELRAVGALQDHALAACRMGVRRLKQQVQSSAGNGSSAADAEADVRRLVEALLRTQ
jgi:hypothetical protein